MSASTPLAWYHSQADSSARLVLLAIADHDGEGGAWPSVATLARMTRLSPSTVRRSVRYDCVTVVTQGDGKQMIHVFLGLITNAEDGLVGRVPVVRRRIAEILLRSGVRADSHTGRQLLAALRTR